MGETAHLRYRFLRSNNVKTPLEYGFYGVLWLSEGVPYPNMGYLGGTGYIRFVTRLSRGYSDFAILLP